MASALLILMFSIAQNDPDAFDMDNLHDYGTYTYMCEMGEYSIELTKLCLQYSKLTATSNVAKQRNK